MNNEHLTNNFQVADVNYSLMRKSNWITVTSGLTQSAKERTRTWSRTSEKKMPKCYIILPFGHVEILLLWQEKQFNSRAINHTS